MRNTRSTVRGEEEEEGEYWVTALSSRKIRVKEVTSTGGILRPPNLNLARKILPDARQRGYRTRASRLLSATDPNVSPFPQHPDYRHSVFVRSTRLSCLLSKKNLEFSTVLREHLL